MRNYAKKCEIEVIRRLKQAEMEKHFEDKKDDREQQRLNQQHIHMFVLNLVFKICATCIVFFVIYYIYKYNSCSDYFRGHNEKQCKNLWNKSRPMRLYVIGYYVVDDSEFRMVRGIDHA